MRHERHLRLYQALISLYPRSFRDEYREDLVDLFSRQMNEEPHVAVWRRTLRDLAVTVPTHHLEAAMQRPPTAVFIGICSVVATSAVALAVAVGAGGPASSLAFLVVALAAGASGVSAWRAQQPIKDVDSSDGLWWKFLLTGAGLVGATAVGMSITWPKAVDLGDNAYWLVLILMMTGTAFAVVGVLLGFAKVFRRQRQRPSAPRAT